MADDSVKPTEDPNFKGGVMSPNSKQTFAQMRFNPPPVNPTQRIVLDEETFELAFLKCSMCKERYNTTDRSPRMLPCHHTFCLQCIIKFFKAESEYRSTHVSGSLQQDIAVPIMCPNCSVTFLTSMVGISELTMDTRIVQLMDFVGTTEKHEMALCPQHAMQCLNFFCESCKQYICRDCTVLDHKKCVAAEKVLDVKAAQEKYLPVVEKGTKEMEAELKSLKEKREDCEKALSSCKEGDQDLISAIKTSFEKIREALNKREKTLLEQAKEKTGGGREEFEEKIKRMTEKEKEAAEIAATLKSFKDFDNLAKLHKTYEKIQTYETEPALDKNSVKPEAPKAKFVGRDEQTLITRLEKFGELQAQEKSMNGSYGSSSYSSTAGYSSSYGSSRYAGSSSLSSTPSAYSSRYTSSRSGYRY